MRTPKQNRVIAAVLAVLLVGLCVVVSVSVHRASRRAAAKARVNHWIHSMDWWDRNGTEAENLRRQSVALRSLGGEALDVFAEELHYDPAYLHFLDRVHFLRTFHSPSDGVDGPGMVRSQAAHYLGILGPLARPAVPDLLRHVVDSDARVRSGVAYALGRIGDDSPQVRVALTNLLADSDRYVPFLAALSLWSFERSNPGSIHRVEALIATTEVSGPSLCFIDLGTNARVFAPALTQVVEKLPLSDMRLRAHQALWMMTGDKQFIFRELDAIAEALTTTAAIDPATGWTFPEVAILTAAHTLDDESDFRDRIRSMLGSLWDKRDSLANKAAGIYLKRFDALDHRDRKRSDFNTHGTNDPTSR